MTEKWFERENQTVWKKNSQHLLVNTVDAGDADVNRREFKIVDGRQGARGFYRSDG